MVLSNDMQDLLNKFSWDSIKFDFQILVCCIIIWLAVLACAISSVWKQPMPRRQKLVWIGIIVGIPLAGLFVYLPFSIQTEGHSQLWDWKPKK
jgi:cytochrome bd-type quinol oxidase subunit 1